MKEEGGGGEEDLKFVNNIKLKDYFVILVDLPQRKENAGCTKVLYKPLSDL